MSIEGSFNWACQQPDWTIVGYFENDNFFTLDWTLRQINHPNPYPSIEDRERMNWEVYESEEDKIIQWLLKRIGHGKTRWKG